MALTITAAGTGNSTTSSATLAFDCGASFAVGDMVVVCVSADNNGSGGATSLSSVTDAQGNTYTQRVNNTQDPGAAAAGQTLGIYTAIVTTALVTTDDITVNFSPNTAAKAALVWKVVAGATEFPKFVAAGSTAAATASPTTGAVSVNSGDVIIGALARESNSTVTADADTTNGNWSTQVSVAGNTGTNATSSQITSQWKVVTATGNQTYNPTATSADLVIGYIEATPAARIQRTADDTGTGTESATGTFFSILQRTASDTGTGTESATGIKYRTFQRTITSTGVGTEEATGQHKHPRTGSSVGTSSESATGNVIPGTTLHQRTASDTGTGTESAAGFKTASRTASNTGSGTESAVGVRKVSRTATATGTGTEAATPAFGTTRTATATGTGTGTESASGAYKRVRTASDTGVGTQTADRQVTPLRTASATGTGSETAVGSRTLRRTASDTGTGTQSCVGARVVRLTGTNTGTGTQTDGGWSKSFIFRPPADDAFPWADFRDPSDEAWFLSKLQRGARARNIFKLKTGVFTNTDPLDPTLVDKVYYGGHQHFVSAEEKADLVAAGYTVT